MNVVRWGAVAGAALTIAAAAVCAAPAATALPLLGGSVAEGVALSEHGNEIVSFATTSPQTATMIGTLSGVDDLPLVGIDYRPGGGGLYGVGQRGTIYRIDDVSAAATKVGSLSTALEGEYFDIDFTPNGDALRVISGTGQNLHQPFDADGPQGATVADGPLSRRNIAAAAYDDSGRLIDIDTTRSQLLLQNPQTGKLQDLGEPGAFPAISTPSNGLDIVGDEAFAVVNLEHVHTLFSVNPTDGTATKVGPFPGHVIDLALKR